MGHSFGHAVLSDWADKADDDPEFAVFKQCGFWTHDEAAILYHCARQLKGKWVEIGGHTGWTAAHILAGEAESVVSIDPLYPPSWKSQHFFQRFRENLTNCGTFDQSIAWGGTSQQFLQCWPPGQQFDGAVIDGSHIEPDPQNDAKGLLPLMKDRCVVLLHDALGRPVQEASQILVDQGFNQKFYYTPHGVIVCWRGDFTPPEHVPDPEVNRQIMDRLK
jgi:rhodanese-related sulfurtransferase